MCVSTGVPDRLGVDEQPVLAAQDAQVGAQLALVGEHDGVAALAGGEPLDVVGHLALEEVGRLAAAQQQLRALGAVDQADAGSQQLVLVDGDHAFETIVENF